MYLKITDINGKNIQILIQQAKGKQDHYVSLPLSILEQLVEHFKKYTI